MSVFLIYTNSYTDYLGIIYLYIAYVILQPSSQYKVQRSIYESLKLIKPRVNTLGY